MQSELNDTQSQPPTDPYEIDTHEQFMGNADDPAALTSHDFCDGCDQEAVADLAVRSPQSESRLG